MPARRRAGAACTAVAGEPAHGVGRHMKKPNDVLEFEAPIAVLLKEVEALSLMPRTDQRDRDIEQLRRRIDSLRREIYANLKPWQRVQLARHPNRPCMLDYVARLFVDFVEIHGDRRCAD